MDQTPDEEDLEELYNWVDEIPLSRQKKNISRDFADGVLVAEICKHYAPTLVDLHNYNSCESKVKKRANWDMLNRKVFRKLSFELADDVLKKVVHAEPFAIEKVLMLLHRKVDRYVFEQKRKKTDSIVSVPGSKTVVKNSDQPEADQNDSWQQTTKNLPRYKGDMVPKIALEEKEQEILAKEETIQILQAKIRRLEHLVHLKDVRIDDLNALVEQLGGNKKNQPPIANTKLLKR